MRRWLKNVFTLSAKELSSLMSDATLLGLIVVVFSLAVYSVSTGVTTEVRNASVAVIDEDRSPLSLRLRDALRAPYFKPPEEIRREQIDALMDKGRYVFVINIPVNFQADALAGRSPHIQVLADATAVTQAGVGTVYIEQIVQREVAEFLGKPPPQAMMPLSPAINVFFNPNSETRWYISVMQVVANITLLAMILVGAAVIREREHGTIEHLLVMPVRASEIAVAKILANGEVITLAALLSLGLVVHLWLGVPINGSVALFALGAAVFLFSVASLGIWLATLAPTMPQFGLLCLPIYVVTRLLSGAETPLESMPDLIQTATQASPVTQFAKYSQDVLFRNADLAIVWPQLLIMAVMGAFFLSLALHRFRRMLAQQG